MDKFTPITDDEANAVAKKIAERWAEIFFEYTSRAWPIEDGRRNVIKVLMFALLHAVLNIFNTAGDGGKVAAFREFAVYFHRMADILQRKEAERC